jgi:protein gp37
MGTETKIEWCNHTFNPWIGCTKVSPGCKNCYASALDRRWGHDRWGAGKPRQRTSAANWKQPISWNKAAEKASVRRKVFCASLADVFDAEVDPEWRKDLFRLIRATPNLDWLLLTKRPENIRELWPFSTAPSAASWPTIWLGTTVENQQQANERIPKLAYIDAAVRFLSCEPLLEGLDLTEWLDEDKTGFVHLIDWIIIGGESGPGARPFQLSWARNLVHQCRDGGRGEAAPFVKQFGAKPEGIAGPLKLVDRHGGDWSEWPPELRVREYPEART